MAILLLGKTNCTICNNTIYENEEYYSFPSFVINTKDEIYFFNDSSFHCHCLTTMPSSESALQMAELFIKSVKPENRKSIITGKAIIIYKNHVFIDYLTSDKKDFLYKFNFAHVDKTELSIWKQRESLIDHLIKLKSSDNWKELEGGKYLTKLIDDLSLVSYR